MNEQSFIGVVRQYNTVSQRMNRDFISPVHEAAWLFVQELERQGMSEADAIAHVNDIGSREYRGWQPLSSIPF